MDGLFAGLMVGTLLLLVTAGSVAASVLQGFLPSYAEVLSNRFWFTLGGATLLLILTLLVGWVVGRAGAARRG